MVTEEEETKIPSPSFADVNASPCSPTSETENIDMPLAADAGDDDGTNIPPNKTESRRTRSPKKPRMCHSAYDNPEMVARLEAVINVNPYQYAAGSAERKDAWNAALRLVGPTTAYKTRSAFRHLIRDCLKRAPITALQFNDAAGPVFQRYMELLNTLIFMEKAKVHSVGSPHSVSDETLRRSGDARKPVTKRLHACTVCKVCYESAELLALHTRGHNPTKVKESGDTTCPACQKKCATVAALIAHVAEHRKAYRPRQECPDCGLFISVYSLEQHIKAKHPEKPDDPTSKFVCGECKKEFASEPSLRNHDQSHRFLRCLFCAQLFSTGTELSQHAVQHRQAAGFICPHPNCPKTFDV
ncbi:replication initiator 1-like [Paramacrobiotus metropolitanus]|uniref:replication initiator 1-like n=1 Tax=Paramacrobiotus metropolitanus TaxID=2943436 RepID=UPI002445FFC3|nr:replication initiator 1-like [Paramacrobiotus metropolitanus]